MFKFSTKIKLTFAGVDGRIISVNPNMAAIGPPVIGIAGAIKLKTYSPLTYIIIMIGSSQTTPSNFPVVAETDLPIKTVRGNSHIKKRQPKLKRKPADMRCY